MPIRPLPPYLVQKAKDELFEDPDKNEEDIRILREWLQKQPHLKTRQDDQFLLTFIRGSKHSLERAKKKIDLHYTIKTGLPEIFKNRFPDNSKVLELVRKGIIFFLPKPMNEDGPRICINRPGVADPDKYRIFDSVRPGTFLHDIGLIKDDNLVVSGLIQIVDLSNLTLAHLFQFDVVTMKKMALFGGEGSTLRHKGTHFINVPSAFETIYNLFRTFMTEKQRSRLYLHGSNLETLYEHIPQKFLPKEYGGENGSFDEMIKDFEATLIDNKDFFMEENQYGTIEELRPKDSKYHPEILFGVDGTFRKLDVD